MSTLLRGALLVLGVGWLMQTATPAEAGRRRLLNSVNAGSAAFIYPAEYQAYVDTMIAHGIRNLRVCGQWGLKCYQCAPDTIEFDAEPSPGVYDFSVYFDRLDFAITTRGMKAAVTFNLGGRLDTDPLNGGSQPVLPSFFTAADVMQARDAAGHDQIFQAGLTKVPKFEKASVRQSMLDFVTAVVTQFRARYGDNILYYAFTFSQFGEDEYPLIGYPGIADTSPEAAAAFQAWLQAHYASPAAVAQAWGHSPPFASFAQIAILDGQPPPATGQAPQAYLDFAAYREDALGTFLHEVRDRIHAAGGNALAQFGSVWDSYSSVRGTLGFGPMVDGFDLALIDDAPEYDHRWSMDYTRTNSLAAQFGNEADGACRFGCTSGNIDLCCYAPTFPDYLDLAQGAVELSSQIEQTYERGAAWVDLANWDNFYTEAFVVYATPVAEAVALAGQPGTTPVATDTLHLSLRDLYAHHHDEAYLQSLINAHHALGGLSHAVAVTVAHDLAPPVVAAVADRAPPGPGTMLAPPAPNPARVGLTVRFTLARREAVWLRVFDLTGRQVAELPQGALEPGAHFAALDASALASGVYMVRLEAPSGVLSRKFEIVR